MNAQVFSNAMVAHVWAQQRQQSGRSNNGNFFFEGRVLYSYGAHYPVGIFTDSGAVFLNSSKSSMTTEGKHKNAARAALPGYGRDAFHMPELDEIQGTIRRADEAGRIGGEARADHARTVARYLAKHWAEIPADSAGAAWLLRATGSRGQWAAMRARFAAKADAKAAKEKAGLARLAVQHGRELAAKPWADVAGDAWREAADYRQRGLRETIKDCRESRLATPKAHKRVRAILWRYETGLRDILARAERDSDYHGNAGRITKARALIARLRRLEAGRIGFVPGYDGPDGPAKLEAALELPTGAGWRALADMLRDIAPLVHVPPAMREAGERLRAKADAIATEREGEERQRQEIASARRRVRESLSAFNRGRRAWREHSAHIAAGVAAGEVTEYNGNRALARTLDSILHHVPDARPWGTERGLELAPHIAARADAIAARAAEIAAELAPVRESLATDMERAAAAAREAERLERERVRNMTAEEKRTAWEAGELSREHVRDVEREAGPLLRAVGAEIDGCTVSGGTLETSQGATVPLRHAFRVFQFAALCRAEAKGWKPGTWGPRHIRVGHFSLDSIAPSGDFVAGCHSIQWPEIERLARRLGVADCLASLPELADELSGAAA